MSDKPAANAEGGLAKERTREYTGRIKNITCTRDENCRINGRNAMLAYLLCMPASMLSHGTQK